MGRSAPGAALDRSTSTDAGELLVPTWSATDALLAALLIGIGPFVRVKAVQPELGVRAAVLVAVVACAALVAIRIPPGMPARAAGRVLGIAVASALGGLAAAGGSPFLPDPSILARAVVGAWILAASLLVLWVLSERRWAVLPAFDRRALPAVAVVLVSSGVVASDPGRLLGSLALFVAAGVAALGTARRGDEVAAFVAWLWGTVRRRELLLAAVLVGIAPLSRTIAIHRSFGIRSTVLGCVVAIAVLVIARIPLAGVRAGLVRLAGVVAAAAVAGLAGARPSPDLLAPSVLGRSVVGVWLLATAGMTWWMLGGRRVLLLPAFDRRSTGVVLAFQVAAALIASESQRLIPALWVSAGGGVVAVLLAGRGAAVAEVRARWWTAARVRATSGPLVLRGMAALGIAWWMLNLAFWTRGALNSGEIGYRAWYDGIEPGWINTGTALLATLAWMQAAVAVGALLLVRGRGIWLRLWTTLVRAAMVATLVTAVGMWVLADG